MAQRDDDTFVSYTLARHGGVVAPASEGFSPESPWRLGRFAPLWSPGAPAA